MGSYKGYEIKVMDEYTDLLDRMAVLIGNDLKYRTGREDWLVEHKIDHWDFCFVMTISLENEERYTIMSASCDSGTFQQMSTLELVGKISSEALAHFWRRPIL